MTKVAFRGRRTKSIRGGQNGKSGQAPNSVRFFVVSLLSKWKVSASGKPGAHEGGFRSLPEHAFETSRKMRWQNVELKRNSASAFEPNLYKILLKLDRKSKTLVIGPALEQNSSNVFGKSKCHSSRPSHIHKLQVGTVNFALIKTTASLQVKLPKIGCLNFQGAKAIRSTQIQLVHRFCLFQDQDAKRRASYGLT